MFTLLVVAKGGWCAARYLEIAKKGVHVSRRGDPTLLACTIRDHGFEGTREYGEGTSYGCGVFVDGLAYGRATIEGCVFARNWRGDVVREAAEEENPSDFEEGSSSEEGSEGSD